MKCLDANLLLRYFSGQLSGRRAAAINAHLAQCATCRSLQNEVVEMITRLEHDPNEFDDPTAVDEVLTLIRLDRTETRAAARPGERGAPWLRWLLVPATAAATAILILLWWSPAESPIADGFQARGSNTEALNQWVSLQAFRATHDGYRPVHGSVAAGDALAFTYLNQSRGQLRFLAVVGVDARGEVYWYYPPHTPADQLAGSVEIQSSDQPIELPEQITHHLPEGPLRIFGLFSAQPLSAPAIEAQLNQKLESGRAVEQLTELGLAGVGEHSILLQVRSNAIEDGP